MALSEEFYAFLTELEGSPNGLKDFDFESPEIKELQRLAKESEGKPRRVRKKQKIPHEHFIDKHLVYLERIRQLRKEKGMRQSDIAFLVNLSTSYYNVKETGYKKFRYAEIKMLADIFEVKEEELFRKERVKWLMNQRKGITSGTSNKTGT